MSLSLSRKDTTRVAMMHSDGPLPERRPPHRLRDLWRHARGPKWGLILILVLVADVLLALGAWIFVGAFLR